jgi:hypothetical protein
MVKAFELMGWGFAAYSHHSSWQSSRLPTSSSAAAVCMEYRPLFPFESAINFPFSLCILPAHYCARAWTECRWFVLI